MPEFVLPTNGSHPLTQALSVLTAAATTATPVETDTPPAPQKRIKPRPEMKHGLVDQLTINFLAKWADDSERLHALLCGALDGTSPCDANQTKILLKILDIIATACGDIELTQAKPKDRQTRANRPPVPGMRS